MNPKWVLLLSISTILLGIVVNCQTSVKPLVKTVKGKKLCDKGWECKGWEQGRRLLYQLRPWWLQAYPRHAATTLVSIVVTTQRLSIGFILLHLP